MAKLASGALRDSDIAEAQALARRCAEPCPAGTNIKGAIRLASQRTGMTYERVRSIWYGEARRIEAGEMDRLRSASESAKIAQALIGVEILRSLPIASVQDSDRLLSELDAALRARAMAT
jgi:hypothetical protein